MTRKMIIIAAIILLASASLMMHSNQEAKTYSLKTISFTLNEENISPACPTIKRAKDWSRRRNGVSFALFCQKEINGWSKRRLSYSASTSKALMLISFLRRGEGVSSNKNDLSSMIRSSDNSAATRIYYQLGDKALAKTTRNLGMRRVVFCGCWSSIRWSPADYTRLFMSLPRSIPKKHRPFAMGLLKNIVSYQRWGIPEGVGKRWKVFFKGGWRPEGYGWIVLQGAMLRKGNQKVALAVFTRNADSLYAGADQIKKVTSLIFKK